MSNIVLLIPWPRFLWEENNNLIRKQQQRKNHDKSWEENLCDEKHAQFFPILKTNKMKAIFSENGEWSIIACKRGQEQALFKLRHELKNWELA